LKVEDVKVLHHYFCVSSTSSVQLTRDSWMHSFRMFSE